jgi:hypothetical protein
MAFDLRGKRDRYTNYFQNNRNIALIRDDDSIDNPRHFSGYGDNAQGRSAAVNSAGGRYHRCWTPSASTRIESRARLAMTIYFVAASDERPAFRILATTPTLRSATSEILYSMEVPKTEATSAPVSL